MSNSKIVRYRQTELDLTVITSKEVDGIEMGVLNDGTPFLTERGLARACGVSRSSIINQAKNYELYKKDEAKTTPKIAEMLAKCGFEGAALFARIQYQGNEVNAYPDMVCATLFEYYAYEAGKHCTEEAQASCRILIRNSLKEFIYKATGYDPTAMLLKSWRYFHDRLLKNPLPSSVFSVFREMADLVLASIDQGLIIDEHTVPDISVGILWSKYWTQSKLSEKYGERTKHPHVYPEYFPQSKANGSIEAYVYPLMALGEFRTWLQLEYLPKNFPTYLQSKVKQGKLPASRRNELLNAVNPS
ncbi:MAG: hypothetical protein IGR80_04025 [Synechococcales cyanobacterium K44_A2020_017]|nr:hypothetical protein [Synechococcales cyanobacterium K32_A2020_035]MBF2093907.1 hypothetical protein [Synechococcales cyanobacterium K44_A2020_017]